MKHRSGACVRAVLLLFPMACLAFGGCSSPVFTVVEKQVCKGLDGSGKPLEETTVFAPGDSRVCIWFTYRNAGAGQVVKARFKHVDALGAESTEEVEQELKPGAGSGVVELTGEEGGPLGVGKYTVELTNQSDVSYGPPLAFTVQ
ncbi:MAG: hypothetical protein FJX74_09515 [Armatimonadetes bacterium]|nr:hypothetical protein [Armatimonadota bacterium]